jgi:peptide/nickel transport system permease protein
MTNVSAQSETLGAKAQPRSYMARVVLDTVGRPGAILGLAWIGLMTVLAVIAPLIASSHPIIIKMDGQWSCPMLKHLTPVDVTLLVTAIAGGVLLLAKRLPWRRLIWLGVIALTLIITWITVKPPQAIVYSQYREAQAEDRVAFVLHTLIPYSPTDRMRDEDDSRTQAPDGQHLMGTTINGEDLFSRMIHASRIALSIGFIATGIAMVIGVILGGLMGYFSGWIDLIGMRLVEIFAAIPTILLLITIVAFYGRSLYLIMAVLGLTGWMGYAIFTRAEFLRLRKQDFVQAAVACGLPLRSILFRHMLPNGVAPILVAASFGIAGAIMAESMLSFLGLGLVDEPSWGQMLNQAQGDEFHWWIGIYPGAAIFLTVFGYNLIGEALRDAIDPHLKKAAQI